jgi:hypothetical protein
MTLTATPARSTHYRRSTVVSPPPRRRQPSVSPSTTPTEAPIATAGACKVAHHAPGTRLAAAPNPHGTQAAPAAPPATTGTRTAARAPALRPQVLHQSLLLARSSQPVLQGAARIRPRLSTSSKPQHRRGRSTSRPPKNRRPSPCLRAGRRLVRGRAPGRPQASSRPPAPTHAAVAPHPRRCFLSPLVSVQRPAARHRHVTPPAPAGRPSKAADGGRPGAGPHHSPAPGRHGEQPPPSRTKGGLTAAPLHPPRVLRTATENQRRPAQHVGPPANRAGSRRASVPAGQIQKAAPPLSFLQAQ